MPIPHCEWRRAGLDGPRLQGLQRGCATFMLAAGTPSWAIMEVLGHSESA
jgi:hypothetical protein